MKKHFVSMKDTEREGEGEKEKIKIADNLDL